MKKLYLIGGTSDCRVTCISLICDASALRERLQKDIDAGIRTKDVMDRSLARIPMYEKLRTVKLDVSHVSAEEAADRILALSEVQK